jgi:hypothetical protein
MAIKPQAGSTKKAARNEPQRLSLAGIRPVGAEGRLKTQVYRSGPVKN